MGTNVSQKLFVPGIFLPSLGSHLPPDASLVTDFFYIYKTLNIADLAEGRVNVMSVLRHYLILIDELSGKRDAN